MPSSQTSKVPGALTIVGLLTAGIVAITTLTATTGNFTTANVQTLSGATIHDTASTILLAAGNGRATTWEATTVSGATIRTTAGNTTITDTLVKSNTLSGGILNVTKQGAGTGTVSLSGSLGGAFCMRNTAGAMEHVTMVSTTLTVRVAQAGECP